MIQLERDDLSTKTNLSYFDLYDKMTNTSYPVLVSITSQLTGKTKYYTPATTYTYKERFVSILTFVSATIGGENLTSGVIFLGSTDYPLGFYDVAIYQNTSSSNLDPTGLTQVYSGLMNLSPTSDAEPVTYSEYTTNDSDTESVYITF
tara:strand:- start:960 stop:1403 length:444 start_codon:yes stop_codon:yes gene_type:complete